MHLARFPLIKLCHAPTPLEFMPNLTKRLDGPQMGFARKVADRVIFMDAGEIVEDATKSEFFANPRSERAQAFLSKILHH